MEARLDRFHWTWFQGVPGHTGHIALISGDVCRSVLLEVTQYVGPRVSLSYRSAI